MGSVPETVNSIRVVEVVSYGWHCSQTLKDLALLSFWSRTDSAPEDFKIQFCLKSWSWGGSWSRTESTPEDFETQSILSLRFVRRIAAPEDFESQFLD